MECLARKPMRASDLHRASGLNPRTLRAGLKALRDRRYVSSTDEFKPLYEITAEGHDANAKAANESGKAVIERGRKAAEKRYGGGKGEAAVSNTAGLSSFSKESHAGEKEENKASQPSEDAARESGIKAVSESGTPLVVEHVHRHYVYHVFGESGQGVTQTPEAAAVVPVPPSMPHPANTGKAIQPLPDKGTDEWENLQRYEALARASNKPEAEIEAEMMSLLRFPEPRVRGAIASVLLKQARGKPVNRPVGLMWSILRGTGTLEEGASANWREIDALLGRKGRMTTTSRSDKSMRFADARDARPLEGIANLLRLDRAEGDGMETRQ